MERNEALDAASSHEWGKRVAAGKWWAEHATEQDGALLLSLLLDEMDTAVTDATAMALFERRDVFGAALVFAALHRGDDQHREHLIWDINDAWRVNGVPVPALAAEVLASRTSDPAEKAGARDALQWLGFSAPPE